MVTERVEKLGLHGAVKVGGEIVEVVGIEDNGIVLKITSSIDVAEVAVPETKPPNRDLVIAHEIDRKITAALATLAAVKTKFCGPPGLTGLG